MSEIDYLKLKLEDKEKAFDKLHKLHMESLKKQGELEKENKKLIKMLDNVANYMQKEHKEIPLDDFVEWWNNIATKGISNGDINESYSYCYRTRNRWRKKL